MRSLIVTLLLLPATLQAQYRLSATYGAGTAVGFARDLDDPEHPALIPDRPRTWGITASRELRAWRLDVGAERVSADLAIRGPEAIISARDQLHAWGFSLGVAHRIVGSVRSPALWAGIGGIAERWQSDGALEESRWRFGGRAHFEGEVPIGRGWSAVLRGEGVGAKSLWKQEEIPEGFRPRAGFRFSSALGLAYRL